MRLLGQFAELLDHMQNWMMGCACHSPTVREELEGFLGQAGVKVALQWPMRGRRGPDLATGQCKKVFMQAAQEQEDTLFMVHLAGLPEADARDLMLDFAAGRARLLSELQIRLSVWDTLPLKLFGLAFHDRDVARQIVLECFVQFEELSRQEQETAFHDLTRQVLAPNGPFREEVIHWLQGAALSPGLEAIVSRMALTPRLEISVERLHAFLKQRTLATHHISGAYASLQLRRPEIIRCHLDHFEELAECCALASTPASMVEALELQHFPDILQFHYEADREEGVQGSVKLTSAVPHSLVDAVIYRRHLDIQYQALPAPALSSGQKRVQTQAADEEETTEDRIAYEHFRTTHSSSCFYSVRKQRDAVTRPLPSSDEPAPALTHDDLVNNFFQPLEDAFKADVRRTDPEALGRLQLEITGSSDGLPLALTDGSLSLQFHDERGEGARSSVLAPVESLHAGPLNLDPNSVALQSRTTRRCQESEYVFFRVVDAHPNRRKRLRTDLMKAIAPSQLAVTVHDVVHCDAEHRRVTVAIQPKGSEASATRLFDGTLDTSQILAWETAEDIVWLWRGHEDEPWLNFGAVPSLLSKLFGSKAFPGVGKLPVSSLEHDTLAALDMLREAGLVKRLQQEGELQEWQLLDHARAELQCGAMLCNAKGALQIRPDQPVRSMTIWELVQSLVQDGFKPGAFSQDVEPFNVSRNGPKNFYSIGSRWCRVYLQVLVCRSKLCEHGITLLPHGRKASFYKAILDTVGASKTKRAGKQLKFADAEGLVNVNLAAAGVRVRGKGGGKVGARPERAEAEEGGVDNAVLDNAQGVEGGEDVPRRVTRTRHPKTHYWPHDQGPCLLTFKPPRTWQATLDVLGACRSKLMIQFQKKTC